MTNSTVRCYNEYILSKKEVKMKMILEELWDLYKVSYLKKNVEIDPSVLAELSVAEKRLIVSLTPEQIATFNELSNYHIEVRAHIEKAAFIEGVKFATRYMIETMNGDSEKQFRKIGNSLTFH